MSRGSSASWVVCLTCGVISWKDAIREFPNQVVVTLGEHGAMYPGTQDAVYVTGYPVEVVDTTGAGDTFNGALAYGLSQDWELAKLSNLPMHQLRYQ